MKKDNPTPGHTPGPWRTGESMGVFGRNRVWCKDKPVASVISHSTSPPDLDPVAQANACLIAAAPELLEACDAAIKHLQSDLVEPGRTVFWKLVSASKKARGES